MEKETIAAIATGITDSGIGIIRISGEEAVNIGDSLFCTPSGRHILKTAESHKMYYGYAVKSHVKNPIEKEWNSPEDAKKNHWKDDVIDEVMIVVMRAPKSFTGEDVVEIQCHGGVFVMRRILSETLFKGARLAEPGEFTKRAFLNGRIDLTRAEAVMDVIQAGNELALSVSVDQLKGTLYQKIQELRRRILSETAFLESALDDPEHTSLEGYSEKLKKELDILLQETDQLISSFQNGRMITEGIHAVIVGKPNVGKSSLMNLLVGEERAIVTDIAGTTRDILQESIRLGNLNLFVTDTAGIHETSDRVEQIGVERAREYAEKADLILYVVDVSLPLDDRDREIVKILKNHKFIIFLNKSDLNAVLTEEDIRNFLFENERDQTFSNRKEYLTKKSVEMINTTSKNGDWIKIFEQKVTELFFRGDIRTNREITITNLRHKEALQEAYHSLLLVKKSVEEEMPEDFYTIDFMDAYSSLGRMIGEEVDDDLVEEIFHRFCTGK